mgnify:CR=1 FL=1
MINEKNNFPNFYLLSENCTPYTSEISATIFIWTPMIDAKSIIGNGIRPAPADHSIYLLVIWSAFSLSALTTEVDFSFFLVAAMMVLNYGVKKVFRLYPNCVWQQLCLSTKSGLIFYVFCKNQQEKNEQWCQQNRCHKWSYETKFPVTTIHAYEYAH